MSEIALKEYMNELRRWGISYDVSDWRVILRGGDRKARYHHERVISEDKDLEAKLILYASNRNRDLRDLIEERAAIRCADGLPGDLLSAVKCNLEEG